LIQKKHFEPIEAILELKIMDIPTETTQSEIIDLRSKENSDNNNDKNIDLVNSNSISSNSKKCIDSLILYKAKL